MRRCRSTLLLCLLTSTGCVHQTGFFLPKEQRHAMEVGNPDRLGPYVAMGAADAGRYVTRGVDPEIHGGTWRWAHRDVELQFDLASLDLRTLVVEATVPDIMFKDTGPVKIAVSVNGHPLDTMVFDTFGPQTLRKTVPAEWLKKGEPVRVQLVSDHEWMAPEKVAYGFILSSAGFVQ